MDLRSLGVDHLEFSEPLTAGTIRDQQLLEDLTDPKHHAELLYRTKHWEVDEFNKLVDANGVRLVKLKILAMALGGDTSAAKLYLAEAREDAQRGQGKRGAEADPASGALSPRRKDRGKKRVERPAESDSPGESDPDE